MLQKESAHNIFRLLMCRDIDLFKLKGVIFDHSCGLDQYILNREPREFKFLRCLVDGAHWNGQKKLRKPDRGGHGGHLGCSEGFNFNLYKEFLPIGINSQGREQIHALIEKMVPSLRQMSYPTFMIMMKGNIPFSGGCLHKTKAPKEGIYCQAQPQPQLGGCAGLIFKISVRQAGTRNSTFHQLLALIVNGKVIYIDKEGLKNV